LPDSLVTELLNHFHQIPMGVKDVRDDDMGQAYEFLIKKFADNANKKAGEFYTPRTVVRLMVNFLDPEADEVVYDPACGTGGMLLETIHHVQERGEDLRLLKLKGQEKNLTTEAIARMNLFLHGKEDFQIIRGDTLQDPKFTDGDKLPHAPSLFSAVTGQWCWPRPYPCSRSTPSHQKSSHGDTPKR